MKTKQKFRLAIMYDTDPENPRQWGNVGTMVCWHSRYTLGDEQPDCAPDEYKRQKVLEEGLGDTWVLEWLDDWFDYVPDRSLACVRHRLRYVLQDVRDGHTSRRYFFDVLWRAYRDAQAIIKEHGSFEEYVEHLFEEHYVVLPLYLYDHGGITMSTGSYSCPWDSGQVGFIYLPKEAARERYGLPEEGEHESSMERWERMLAREVETYSQYLEGEVYGFVLEEGLPYKKTVAYRDGKVVETEGIEWVEADSCWGFFGHDITTNGMADHLSGEALEAAKRVAPSLIGAATWEYFEEVIGNDEEGS